MVLSNPEDCLANGPGHTGASALGGRSDPSIATAKADRARQLASEEVALGVRLGSTRGVAPGLRLLDVVFDLREAPAIGILGSLVEDRSGVTERRGRDLRAHIARRGHVHFSRDQIDDVKFPMGIGEEARDVPRTLEIPHRLVIRFELGFESDRDHDGTARRLPDSDAWRPWASS